MLPIEDQISLLVQLSKADHFVAEQESKMIHVVGKRGGLTEEEVENIIDHPKPIGELRTLPSDEKFNYLFNTIQLMKVDGKVHSSEITFCEKVAIKLGFKPGVVADLSAYIYSDPDVVTNVKFLRSIADQHMIPYHEQDDED